jgi:hypothetical protein
MSAVIHKSLLFSHLFLSVFHMEASCGHLHSVSNRKSRTTKMERQAVSSFFFKVRQAVF